MFGAHTYAKAHLNYKAIQKLVKHRMPAYVCQPLHKKTGIDATCKTKKAINRFD